MTLSEKRLLPSSQKIVAGFRESRCRLEVSFEELHQFLQHQENSHRSCIRGFCVVREVEPRKDGRTFYSKESDQSKDQLSSDIDESYIIEHNSSPFDATWILFKSSEPYCILYAGSAKQSPPFMAESMQLAAQDRNTVRSRPEWGKSQDR